MRRQHALLRHCGTGTFRAGMLWGIGRHPRPHHRLRCLPAVQGDRGVRTDHHAGDAGNVAHACESGWKGRPAMRILCGGEKLPAGLAAALLERAAEVWNMYGPTETTVWSTCKRIESVETPISVGRPIANTTAYILDEKMTARARGNSRQSLYRRGRPCPRLPQPPGIDQGKIRSQSVLGLRRPVALLHGRPCQIPFQWGNSHPWKKRLPDQTPRPQGRTG